MEHQGQEGSVLRIPAERVQARGLQVEAVGRGAVREPIATTAFIEPHATWIVHVTPRILGKMAAYRKDVYP